MTKSNNKIVEFPQRIHINKYLGFTSNIWDIHIGGSSDDVLVFDIDKLSKEDKINMIKSLADSLII